MIQSSTQKKVVKIAKAIFNPLKKLAYFIGYIFCGYLISIILENLNELIFQSYQTSILFRKFSEGYIDLDFIVKYWDHYWEIISSSMVLFVLFFGVMVPPFSNLVKIVRIKIQKQNKKSN